MSGVGRAFGIARSLAIYHLIPGRQRRLRRLYAGLVRAGDLVFDVGAHAGNRTRALRALGCRVVAVEPQPDFARLLRRLFARAGSVEVVEAAVSARPGRSTLSISERTPTVTTLVESWSRARSGDRGFAGVGWNRQIEVDVTTLDDLVTRFGMPVFVKIDVEGSEPDVLAGLSRPVPLVSFEFLPGALAQVEAAVAELSRLGRYRFNWSSGERQQLEAAEWMEGTDLLRQLASPRGRRTCGDVYARLTG